MVLFTSYKPLVRAENIKAVYDAYSGEKEFVQLNPWVNNPELTAKRFTVMVADEFVSSSPGKAVMIGHAVSGGKTFGLHQPHPYYSRNNARYLDYVVTTSEAMVELTAGQCGVDKSQVLPLGLPRSDAYFGAKKGDGNTFLAKERAYLFAPTYRAKEETPLQAIDWQYIDDHLTDGEILVVKPHMMTKHLLTGNYRHIVEVSSKEPSTPYLIDCDVLVTDYSSIMMDAHILGRPVVLFEKQAGYLETRGMYLEYPGGYASRYCTSESEMVHLMQTADKPGKEDIRCREVTASACDGHSTERVVNLIKGLV